MIRVFIYHKNSEIMEFIHKIVDESFHRVKHNYRICSTANRNDAAAYLKRIADIADIFFFDFSEFEIAYKYVAYLRQQNTTASWVHIGSIHSLLKTLYLRPSAFIENSGDKDKITEIITNLENLHQRIQAKNYFMFKYEGEHIRVSYDNIDYFESDAKKVILHLSNNQNKYYFTAKLSDIQVHLPPFFLRCHQSYIVNMNKIQNINPINHSFNLVSNEVVFISKRMFPMSKEKYNEYISSKNNKML